MLQLMLFALGELAVLVLIMNNRGQSCLAK